MTEFSASNDGARPSRLRLDRYATGELGPDERRAVEARLDDHARAHLAAVEAARAEVRPLDLAALRARAAALDVPPIAPSSPVDGPVALPPRANRWLRLLALAAVALLAVGPLLLRPDEQAPEGYVGVRGGEALQPWVLRDGALHPWDGAPVGEGDVLGFTVRGGGEAVVVLSVDGAGRASVFWPEQGEVPEPLPADGRLPGTVVLDGAPGPEVFVAVFDASPAEARREALRAWEEAGPDGVVAWADRAPHVAAVRVERR